MSINATITGRLAFDPETRTTPSGHTICEFKIPADHGYGDRKTTTWVKVSAWGKRGEPVQQFKRKGDWLTVSGELWTEEYKGKTYVKMDADRVQFVGDRQDSGDRQESKQPQRPQRKPQQKSYDDESEIPF